MTAQLTEFFIHPRHKVDTSTYHKVKLLVKASLLTSLFSNFYIWISLFIDFEIAAWLMIFNVSGFLLLAFLCKTPLPFRLLGNLYVAIGAIAVLIIPYFSGGIYSPNYPWIISIPILAVLIVNRTSGIIWGLVSLIYMVSLGILDLQGFTFPELYNTDLKSYYYVAVLPGLLLIILVLSLVFSTTQQSALIKLEDSYRQLSAQKDTIAVQSTRLEKLIEEKDQFIRMLAHDLKNPLSNIRNIAKMIEQNPENEDVLNYNQMFSEVSGRGLQLIDNVLKMAVLEDGGISLKLEEIALENAIQSSISSLRPLAVNKGITVEILNEHQELKVKADSMYLEQIFDNLISNALKYSPKGSKVDVFVDHLDQSAIIKVMDEGPGIAANEIPNLFQKFSKLSNMPTDNESSSGLGLSLVREYVSQLQGKVYYETGKKEGASFVVELPLA